MKTTHLFILIIFILWSCNNKNEFVINGSFKGEPSDEWIYLEKFDPQQMSIDSAKVIDGRFTFTGTIESVDVYAIQYNRNEAIGELAIFIEPGKINVIIDPEDLAFGSEIIGGIFNEEYKKFKKLTKTDERANVNWDTERPDEILEINARMWESQNEFYNQCLEYIKTNPHSPISVYLLSNKFTILPLKEQKELLATFTSSVHHMSLYTYYKATYENQVKLLDNTPAFSMNSNGLSKIEIDFSNSTILKTLIAQNPNKGMYIDVWGTWCGPCIASFPKMKLLQEKFAKDDVIFIYLCVMSIEDDWIKMVKEKNLIGQHYLLGNSLLDRLNREAQVIGFPRYILVNKKGKVSLNAPNPYSKIIEETLSALVN